MQKRIARSGTVPTHVLATDLRVIAGQLRRRLREQSGAETYSASQKAVIIRLERDGPATVTTLARVEGVKPQSMGATIVGLEEQGLIARQPDPADGRQTILSLTPKSHEFIRASRAAREDWLYRALNSKLTREEQAQLATAIALLNRLLQP